MWCDTFKGVTCKLFTGKLYIYVYIYDLALNNPQGFMFTKKQTNQPTNQIKTYFCGVGTKETTRGDWL